MSRASRWCAIIALSLTPLTLHAQQDPPTIGPDTYKQRRQILLDSLGEGTAVLYSQGEYGETGYRADGNFWYLTGLDEPGAILILAPNEYDKDMLLLPPRDMDAERWTGMRPTLSESLQVVWQFDRISRTGRLNGTITGNMKHDPVLHLISGLVSPSKDVPKDLEFYHKVTDRIPGVSIKNSSRLIEHMRMVKSPDEIMAIDHAQLRANIRAMYLKQW